MKGQVSAFLASLESQPAYSKSTRLAYDNDLRCLVAFLETELGRTPSLEDLTAENIANFLHSEREAGRRASTLLRRRASIRRFINFLSSRCPEWAAEFKKHEHLIDEAITVFSPVQIPNYLDDEQIQALQAVLEASSRPRARRDHAILALLLETGLSVGSLITLNLEDVDAEQGSIHLCLDNGADFWLQLTEAAEPLRRYLKEGRPELNYHLDEPALFISQTGARMSRQGVWQVLRQWGNRAGLKVTLSPRLIRHTAAHRLARSGRPVTDLQALLGHRHPLSTQALLRRLSARGERNHKE